MLPISNVSQIFTDTGMPISHSVEYRRANPRLHFLLWQCTRFHDVAENTLIALHGKLNMVAQVVTRFWG